MDQIAGPEGTQRSPLRFPEVWCSMTQVVLFMAPLGVLMLLYALASWVWPMLGQQLVLFHWMQGLPAVGQFSIRAGLGAIGIALVVAAWMRRRR